MTAHACETCGLLHDAPVPQESEAVAIARIQAENAVTLAKISARQDRDWNETRVEVAEIEGEAAAEVAQAEAEVVGAILATEGGAETAEPPGEPIVVEAAAAAAEPEAAAEEPPVVETTVPKGKNSGGYWGAYK